MDVKPQIQELFDYVTLCLQDEQDFYKKALLSRIQTNAKAIIHLIEGGFWVEAPVLLRVSFEHVCRLYLFNKDRLAFSDPKNFKLMGKTPSPKEAIKDFGEEFQVVYEALCSFSHPDMMSMVLNQELSPKDEFTCQLIIAMSALMNIIILLSVYPDLKDTEFVARINHQVNDLMQTMGTEFLDIVSLNDHLFEELDNLMNTFPFMQQPFKRGELNDELSDFIQQYKRGDLKKIIEDKIKSL